jgi:hypothetical protein
MSNAITNNANPSPPSFAFEGVNAWPVDCVTRSFGFSSTTAGRVFLAAFYQHQPALQFSARHQTAVSAVPAGLGGQWELCPQLAER